MLAGVDLESGTDRNVSFRSELWQEVQHDGPTLHWANQYRHRHCYKCSEIPPRLFPLQVLLQVLEARLKRCMPDATLVCLLRRNAIMLGTKVTTMVLKHITGMALREKMLTSLHWCHPWQLWYALNTWHWHECWDTWSQPWDWINRLQSLCTPCTYVLEARQWKLAGAQKSSCRKLTYCMDTSHVNRCCCWEHSVHAWSYFIFLEQDQ